LENGLCTKARNHLSDRSIRDISIDITPLFTRAQLDESSAVNYEEELEAELAKSPVHTFHDRQGQVLAEGRLVDFRQGRIWVADEAGETVKVEFSELSDDDLCFVSSWWSIPTECALGDELYRGRNWLAQTVHWKASGVCHKPLYFEEVQLERYGHTAGPIAQPVLSGAHFFLNVAALPYKLGIHPPNECRYPLGYYRPGSCAPWLVPPIPLSIRGGLLAAGVYTGGVFVIP
jgi:hypothetical protein